MGELHNHGSTNHVIGHRPWAIVAGEQSEHHAESLPAGLSEVADLIGQEGFSLPKFIQQHVFRALQTIGERRIQRWTI